MTLGSTLARGAALLVRNPIIVVPPIVIGTVAGFLEAILRPSSGADVSTPVAAYWLAEGVATIASVLTLAITTGMADAGWKTGRMQLGDGFTAFRHEGRRVFVAMFAMGLLGYAAALLSPYTAFLSMVIWAFLCIYTIAGAVAGGHEGFVALAQSIRLALRKPVTTLLMIVALAIVFVASVVLAGSLPETGVLGPMIAALLRQAAIAYLSLVTVGEYETLLPA